MAEGSLTIVLPAFNEEARLGPALDELFGYLAPARPPGPRRAPGRGRAAARRPGARRGRRQHGRHAGPGQGTARRSAAGDLEVMTGPARWQGRRGACRDAGRARGPRGLRRRGHGHPAGRDRAPGGGAPDRGRGVRQPDPGRRQRHAQVPAGAGGGPWARPSTPSRRCGSWGPSRTRSAGSRASGAMSRATCSPGRRSPASCSTWRSSSSCAGAATRSACCPSAGRTGAARGCTRGSGLPLRVAWDLFRTPLIHRDVGRVARGATDQPAN